MGLINDIKEELGSLEQTPKKLKQFSGLMLFVSGIFLYYFYPWKPSFWLGSFSVFSVIFLIGLFIPSAVRKIQRLWMGLAFIMGWFVSRFLLGLIYFFIVAPIGAISRVFGKRFIETAFKTDSGSYWKKRANPKIDYTKMS